ncbi:MAG TPA: LysM peptidoglycan-binding domain-containing protein, partial [Ilumatobacteraceae bacterium]|nr:LysM peptidoglycan-binding domain-containing protein [Ilumatobacteraceae bacterium]
MPATTAAPTTTAPLVCAKDYDVLQGDYWIGIADKVDVRLAELLQANRATVKTALYPGRTICLPASASDPTVPTTAAPTTTAKPTQTTPTTSTPTTPTTAKPTTTTAAPATTTTVKPPANTYTKAQVADIIRQIWPDDLEDEAIRIATRESNLIPTVRNSCCFGLFQIY